MRPERGEPPVVLSPEGCLCLLNHVGGGEVAELLSEEEGKVWGSAWG